MAEFILYVIAIFIGVGFCLFVTNLPTVLETLSELKEDSKYPIVRILSTLLWIIVVLIGFGLAISAAFGAISTLKDIGTYFTKE